MNRTIKICSTLLIVFFSMIYYNKPVIASELQLPAIQVKSSAIGDEYKDKLLSEYEAKKLVANYLNTKLTISPDVTKRLRVINITPKELFDLSNVQIFYISNYPYALALYHNGELSLVHTRENHVFIGSMFLSDENNDGVYELYANTVKGAGISIYSVLKIDIMSGESVEISRGINEHFTVFLHNNQLYVQKYFGYDNLLFSWGKLVLTDEGTLEYSDIDSGSYKEHMGVDILVNDVLLTSEQLYFYPALIDNREYPLPTLNSVNHDMQLMSYLKVVEAEDKSIVNLEILNNARTPAFIEVYQEIFLPFFYTGQSPKELEVKDNQIVIEKNENTKNDYLYRVIVTYDNGDKMIYEFVVSYTNS